MGVTVKINDRKNKYPPKEYVHAIDPSVHNRYWYKPAIDKYAAEVGHPAFNPRTMQAGQYYDRFWAEIVRQSVPAKVEPAPAPIPENAVTTAQGNVRVFIVNRKGTDYSFTTPLSDDEAVFVCRLITDPRDGPFSRELLQKFPNLSPKQWAWVHKLAMDELKRRNDPRALNNPVPPPPPPEPGYTPRPVKERYKPRRGYRKNALIPQEAAAEINKIAAVSSEPKFPADGTVVDASDQGFRPGEFPVKFEYDGMTYLRYGEERDAENELLAVLYSSDGVFYLKVVND